MEAIGGMPFAQARSLFFSSQNAKARLDMIRSLIGISTLSNSHKKLAAKLLDRAKNVADRRNDLIHGLYGTEQRTADPLSPPKHILIRFKPATSVPLEARPVDSKEVDKLLADYDALRKDLSDFHIDVVVRPIMPSVPSRGTPK